MSTTIDSLDIQITTSASQAQQKIQDLSKSLEGLRKNARLTTVVNNLNNLRTALDGIPDTTRLRQLANTLDRLATIPRLTNLSATIRDLRRIPDVVNNINDAALERFQRSMTRLATALRPLAVQINAITRGFDRLPREMRDAADAANRFDRANRDVNQSLNQGSVGLMATISNYQTLISVVNGVVQTMSDVLSQSIEWDGIQFRFGQSFGEDAEEAYNWILKINDALGINVQEFMQYSGLYASLLNGFGLAQEKVSEIAIGLTELSYDIWAFSNDRFKSLEDASEAIRSAITGEIEPIRNAGIALSEASQY